MMASAAVLVSCQEKEENLGVPEITLDPTTLEFGQQGGVDNAKTLTVTSTRDWTIEQDENEKWVTFSPASGSASSEPQTVTVTVTDNNESDRTATIVFKAATVRKELKVMQKGAVSKEYTDLSEVRAMFTGESSVTLGDDINVKATVISNSVLNNLISKKAIYVQDETAGLYIFFDANHEFAFGDQIEINLSGATMKLSGGAIQVDALPLSNANKLSDGQVTPKEVTVSDFMAGKYESQYITLPKVQVEDEEEQTFADAESHKSVGFVTEDGFKFVVFTAKHAAEETWGSKNVPTGSGPISGIAMEYNGTMQLIFAQESDFAGLTGERFGDAPAQEMTIKEIHEAKGGNVITSGTVMAQYANGFVISDETASILVYQGYNPETAVKIGDNITVEGACEVYSGMAQIADPQITVNSSDNPVSYPDAIVLDGAKADELLSATMPQFIEGSGKLLKEGNYYNVYIDGSSRSTKICCIYPTEEQEAKLTEYLNSSVKVTGYHIGVYNTSLNTMSVNIEQIGEPEDPDEPGAPVKVTIEEFLAAAEDDTYYELTGTITNIASTYYGNLTIEDNTGAVYIYGLTATKQSSNDNSFESLGLKVGDILTLATKRGSHNGTPQGGGNPDPAYYISHEPGEDPDPVDPDSPYVSNVTWSLGKNSYNEKATVNGEGPVDVVKIGKSDTKGSIDITIPSGTTQVNFYAVSWNDETATLSFVMNGQEVASQSIAKNAGAANSQPYTFTVTESDYYTFKTPMPLPNCYDSRKCKGYSMGNQGCFRINFYKRTS